MEETLTYFSFPLNVILALLWMAIWVILWKNHRDSRIVRFMLSPYATISALFLLLVSCLWLGFSVDRRFVGSVMFIALLLYVQTILLLVILRGWRRVDGQIRWRFLLVHAGLLLAVGAGFWGSPDSYEARVKLELGESAREAYLLDGQRFVLPYEVLLEDCRTEFSKGGKPIHYEAVVSIDGSKPVSITVNHPYGVRPGEDIYIASVSDSGCVLQIVREPWRYLALAGIVMLLAGALMLFIKGPERRL
jgi:hypothetical protein